MGTANIQITQPISTVSLTKAGHTVDIVAESGHTTLSSGGTPVILESSTGVVTVNIETGVGARGPAGLDSTVPGPQGPAGAPGDDAMVYERINVHTTDNTTGDVYVQEANDVDWIIKRITVNGIVTRATGLLNTAETSWNNRESLVYT